jgi:hypothetical protein
MRLLASLGLLTLAAMTACGSSSVTSDPGDGGSTPAAPTACASAQECNPDQCVCTDGETFQTATVCLQGSCSTGGNDSFCASMCKSHGGVTAIRPNPNVATSAECDAWCNKGAALGCGSTKCNRFFFCSVGKHSCEAAARAALACAVDKGKWDCSKQSTSWSVSSSCGTFAELCTGTGADAGTK